MTESKEAKPSVELPNSGPISELSIPSLTEGSHQVDSVAKVWNEIFQEDASIIKFEQISATDVLDRNLIKVPQYNTTESITTSSTTTYPVLKRGREDDISFYSIAPGGITISTPDLKTGSSYRRRKPENGFKAIFVACYSRDAYTMTKKKLTYSSYKVEDYYNDLIKKMEIVESELHLEAPNFFAEGINLIGAQIWFVTLALGRQFSDGKLEPEDYKKIQNLYQTLVETSVWLKKKNSILEDTLDNFEDDALRYVRSMKKSYAGRSETDLSTEQIGDETFLGEDQTSMTNLAVRAMINRKLWEDKTIANPYVKERTESENIELVLHVPDNLNERKHFDIFMRNVTKAGWVDFQVHFSPKSKVDMMEAVLSQIVLGIKTIRRYLPSIVKKFQQGCGHYCTSATCIPWARLIVNYVDVVVNSDEYNGKDSEIVRLQIFAIEIFLKNIITRGNLLRKGIRDIIETILLSCDYLEHLYFFRIPKYNSLAELKKNCNPKSDKELQPQRFDEGDFFLNDYIIVLKHVPIRYGMTEYILVNGVSVSERHSGANFDGPRFLIVG